MSGSRSLKVKLAPLAWLSTCDLLPGDATTLYEVTGEFPSSFGEVNVTIALLFSVAFATTYLTLAGAVIVVVVNSMVLDSPTPSELKA